jgi:hypothetical protein
VMESMNLIWMCYRPVSKVLQDVTRLPARFDGGGHGYTGALDTPIPCYPYPDEWWICIYFVRLPTATWQRLVLCESVVDKTMWIGHTTYHPPPPPQKQLRAARRVQVLVGQGGKVGKGGPRRRTPSEMRSHSTPRTGSNSSKVRTEGEGPTRTPPSTCPMFTWHHANGLGTGRGG